jgi:hypothetical protein
MTTAVTKDVTKEDGVTPADPFDRGNGRIRADTAADATLTMDVSAADYFAGGDGQIGQVDFNYPSININTLPGGLTTPRTFTNVSDDTVTYKVTGKSFAPGFSIKATPNQFTLDPGDSATINIQVAVSGPDADAGQKFGRVTLNPQNGGTTQHLEVAWVPGQGKVTLSNTCDVHKVSVGGTAHCTAQITNLSPTDANVNASLATNGSVVRIANVTGATSSNNHNWTFTGTLTPSNAPTIDDIVPGGQGYGYVSLASLGVAPLTGTSDESITNISWSGGPIYYGGEAYTEAGIVSNGYVVLGGGDALDVDYIPQSLPDPARPNNVIAGFWTDLHPTDSNGGGGSMYVAGVGDGVNDWIVFEWEGVHVYSTEEPETFQIWLLQGSEGNTLEYGTMVGSGDPIGLTVGAENRNGESGVELGSVPATGDEYTVVTSPPAPGGSATINYDAVGVSPGHQNLTAKMTSDITPGTTVWRWNFRVQ